MGKRKKSSRKPGTRKTMAPLDKSFKCLFCQHQGAITCKMDHRVMMGRLDCKDCGQTFTVQISHLSEPIDVYSEWIDACERANRGGVPDTFDEQELPGDTSVLSPGAEDLPPLDNYAEEEAESDFEDLDHSSKRARVRDDEDSDGGFAVVNTTVAPSRPQAAPKQPKASRRVIDDDEDSE